jgi:hypothetical protein
MFLSYTSLFLTAVLPVINLIRLLPNQCMNGLNHIGSRKTSSMLFVHSKR